VTTRREKPDVIGTSSLSERGHHDSARLSRSRCGIRRGSAGQRAIVVLLGALPTSRRCASYPEPERWALSLGAKGISVPESMWNYRNCGDPPSAGSRTQMANFADCHDSSERCWPTSENRGVPGWNPNLAWVGDGRFRL
jgi:hypothetical protein